MERDFMGVTIKQENQEETKDYSAMQWSFPNKSSGPQLLSFNGTSEEMPKTGFESLASNGLVSVTTTESYDSAHKTYSNLVQTNMVLENQGIRYSVTNYPSQQLDANSSHRLESRVSPGNSQTNQTVSIALSNPFQKSFSPVVGRDLASLSNAQSPRDVSRTGIVPGIPVGTNVVGSTDLRTGTKPAATSAQLTIFYAGSVCVYNDVSPEKAQAIMLLAGNGPCATSKTTLPTTPVQTPLSRSSVLDRAVVNQSHTSMPCVSIPISVASHGGAQPAGPSGGCTDMTSVKPRIALGSPCSTKEPSTTVNILESFPSTLSSSAVPQARKASLTRFLERRRGRIINTSPYARNQSPDGSSNSSSAAKGFAINSSNSYPVPATS